MTSTSPACSSRLGGVLLAALVLWTTGARATPYTFTTVVDSTASFSDFDRFPAINAGGDVAFLGVRNGGGETIAVGDGGSLTPIATTGNDFFFFGRPSINAGGTAAFYALQPGAERIMTGSGGALTTVASTGATFSRLDSATSINSSGKVAFHALLATGGEALAIGSGGPISTVASTAPPLDTFHFFGTPSINTGGTLGYGVYVFNNAGSELLVGTAGAKFVAQNFPPFASFNDFAINDAGTMVFSVDLTSGGNGIFTGHGTTNASGPFTLVADTSGPFASMHGAAINTDGTVAFEAGLDAGGKGIFTGSDPILDKVIGTGDALAGSFVTDLDFYSQGLNDSGSLAFYATLADGRHGIFRADLSPDVASVPEPGSFSLFAAFGLLWFGVTYRRRA